MAHPAPLRVSPSRAASRIEVLEDRIAPAVSASIQLTVLVITGDNLDNVVMLRNDPNNANQVLIDVGDDGATTPDLGPFAKASFASVAFDAQGGNDTFIVDYVSGDPLSGGKLFTYNPLGVVGDDGLTIRNLTGASPLDTAAIQLSSAVANNATVTVNGANLTTNTLTRGVTFQNVAKVNVTTMAGLDAFTLEAGTLAGFGKLSGTANTFSHLVNYTGVSNLTVNLGMSDGATPVADVFTVKALAGTGLTNLTLSGGAGNDTLDLQATVTTLDLPMTGGAFTFNGGMNVGDNDTVKVALATPYTVDGGTSRLVYGDASILNFTTTELFNLTAGTSATYIGDGAPSTPGPRNPGTHDVAWTPSATANNAGHLDITGGVAIDIDYSGPLFDPAGENAHPQYTGRRGLVLAEQWAGRWLPFAQRLGRRRRLYACGYFQVGHLGHC